MARTSLTIRRRGLIPWLLTVLLLGACAMVPPVQEMSDARQAIRSAVDADAQKQAPDTLREAESLMEQATRSLERGAYEQARREAVAAKEQAIEARDRSVARTATTAP